MDFISKFKKTDEAPPTYDDEGGPEDPSSYATEEGYSDKKPSYSTAIDEQQPPHAEQGFSKKPSDEYQKPEGVYGEDSTEDGFSKKPVSNTGTDDEYEKPEEGGYGEELSDKPPSGGGASATTEIDNHYGKDTSTTEDYSLTGADSGEGYDADATGTYLKKPSPGYGATTGDYASGDKYNE